MSERDPHTKQLDDAAAQAATAEWAPAPPNASQHAPTVTGDFHSTSGPHHALRRTRPDTTAFETADPAPQFPDLPGLTVEAFIDSGGMGRVYRAHQHTLNRTVAVKIITASGKDGLIPRDRFRREVESLAQIAHPNIVPIYGAGEWLGFPYFTMKFMAGGPLAKQMTRFAGRTTETVLLMAKVARGLQALHERGIIHRDLKPLNILLDDGDEPVIADFGLAKWMEDLDSSLTLTHAAIGTKYYMSPEQTLGLKREFGAGCDIWSFGVTLYEVLVGRRPFREELGADTFEQIRTADPDFPATLPPDLIAVLQRCLQKKPGDRYPSAAALADDLEHHLAGRPVTTPLELRKPPKRQRRWPLAAGAAAVCIAVGALAATWKSDPTIATEPEVVKGIAEQLRDGETVTLIPAKGLPTRAAPPIFGTNTQLALNAEGYAALNSAGVAGVELCDAELPLPVRLKAEYAVIVVQDFRSSGGVFGGRNETPFGNGTQQSMVILGHRTVPEDAKSQKESAGFESITWWKAPPGQSRQMVPFEWLVPAPDPNIVVPNWRTVELIITDKDLMGTFEGNPVPPFWGRDNPQLVLGRGLGLFCYNSEVIFRNVVLEPLKP